MSRPQKNFEPDPMSEAYKQHVDRTLIRENLRLSVEERFEKLMRLQEFAGELRRAGQEQNSAYPVAHQWYSNYLLALGRSEEALAEGKRALELDPVSPFMNYHMGWLLCVARQFDGAIEQERKTLEMDPGFPPAHALLARAYIAKGMYREALAEYEKYSVLTPGNPAALAYLG